jgi:flagellar motor protein MotB
MSEMKQDAKSQAVIESIVEQFGDAQQVAMLHASAALNRHTMKVGSAVDALKQKNAENRRRAATGTKGSPGRKTRVQTIRDGQRQTIGGPLLFEPGSAVMFEETREALAKIAESLRGKRHMIEVKGYAPTAALSPNSKFADPYELASARVRTVVDYLVQQGGLRRQLIRTTIAAPVESTTLPLLETGEPMNELVTIQAAESSSLDFETGGAAESPLGRP